MPLGFNWDEEDALDQAEQQKKAVQRKSESSVAVSPVGGIVPPAEAPSTTTTTKAPVAPTPAKEQTFSESVKKNVWPWLNPVHLKEGKQEFNSYMDIDPLATGLHGLADYLGIKLLGAGASGVGQGVGKRIGNAIAGVDPTIAAQNKALVDRAEKELEIARIKYGQAQGPDQKLLSTPGGRVEPTFGEGPLSPPAQQQALVVEEAAKQGTPITQNSLQQVQQRLADTQKAMEAKGPAPAPQPTAPAPVAPVAQAPQNIAPTTAAEVPVTTQAPVATATQPTTTTVPEEKTVQGRVRRTKEQIAADKLAAEAASPPGFHPTYKKRTGEMGPGAFNWLYNLKGPEEAIKFWEEAVGKKNVPYSEFVKNYNLASGENITGPVKSVKPSVNAGTPTHVPNYIKGGATPGSLGGLAAMAALLGLGNTEKAQAAMAKAAGAIKDIGISPDIFAGKGEELGRLGQGYVSAGNPNYIRELSAQLATERDPERKAILQNEIRKAGGVAPAMR